MKETQELKGKNSQIEAMRADARAKGLREFAVKNKEGKICGYYFATKKKKK